MAKSVIVAAFAAGLLYGAAAGPALAQTCDTQIAHLAARYGLTDAAPPVSPQPPTTLEAQQLTAAERNAQSRGVLTPPDIGAPVATTPMSGSSLPPPAIAAPLTGDTGALQPAERQRMTALMDAGREASRRGDTTQCLDRLRAAEAIPGVSGSSRP